jgi:hypothetical protein
MVNVSWFRLCCWSVGAAGAGALGMGEKVGGASPLRSLLEATVSRRQLHETMAGILTALVFPARACGMEARGKTQHRTQVKPRKAGSTWVSVPANATPNFQPRSERYWGRRRREAFLPYPRRPPRVHADGRTLGIENARPMPEEESDHLIVAMKPAKAEGAKGMMG